MKALLLTLLLGLNAALLACAPERAAPQRASSADSLAAYSPAADTLVTLERTPCFGTCPSYSVTVLRNGTVRYEGRRFVAREGAAERRIDSTRVEALVEAFRDAGYSGLRNSYNAGDECERYLTDHPTTITSLRLAGAAKRVRHYHGCRGFPAEQRLSALEDTIDVLTGIRPWVSGADATP